MRSIKLCYKLFLAFAVLVLFLALATLAFGLAPPRTAQAAGVLYVKSGGWGDCSSWARACPLQAALALATAGDEIWAAEGVYKPAPTLDRSATFQLKDGVALYGGFAGTETSRDGRDWLSHVTVLSGDLKGDDITDDQGVITDTADIRGGNSYHVVTGSGMDATALLDGFIVTGGKADGVYGSNNDRGGGMYNQAGSPTLRHLVFSGNFGGAWGGGGMENIHASHPTLINVVFRGNSVSGAGGGLDNSHDSHPTLVNVIFSGNSAVEGGGAIVNFDDCRPKLINVTLHDNSTDRIGGGILNVGTSHATLTNTILWGNTAPNGPQIYNASSNPKISYSLVAGGCPAGSTCDHVTDSDPQFVDAARGDLHLELTSPAVDAGDTSALPADSTDLDGDGDTDEPLPLDLDGYPRRVDIPDAPDTGVGPAPVVDMGAYEAQMRMNKTYLPLIMKDQQ